MRRRTIFTVVVALMVVVVLSTFLLGRYLTPSDQQRIVEQQFAPVATSVP